MFHLRDLYGVNTCVQVHTVTRAFPYTVLTFVICDTAPQRDQFFCQRALSLSCAEIIFFLHVQRTDSWKCRHPVVKCWCYLYMLICVAVIYKTSEKCKRIEYFCEDYNLFILKSNRSKCESFKKKKKKEDLNKKALSVEHEVVAHYVWVVWHHVLATLHFVSSWSGMNKNGQLGLLQIKI